MRSILIALVIAALPLMATAGDVEKFCGLDMPCVCQIDCVYIDVDCCCWDGSNDPLTIEFVGADDVVLGTAVIEGPWCECSPCGPNQYGMLDNSVNPYDVDYVRVTAGEDTLAIEWLCIKVKSYDPCRCKSKWHTIFKDEMCCYDAGSFILY